MKMLCGGCGSGSVQAVCVDAFAKAGVSKIHWECWSECNLPCAFCFRMKGQALDTAESIELLRIVKTGGTKTIAFAGGDPSLRTDLTDLVDFAKTCGLVVEIQTNSQHQPVSFLSTLENVDLVGVSLDANEAECHDLFRGKPGNFKQVIRLLDFLEDCRTPVVVRSVVSALNYDSVPPVADVLRNYNNVVRWSLLEFTPIGSGFDNRAQFELPRQQYELTAAEAKRRAGTDIEIDIYRNEDKAGTYALVTPDGQLYGTAEGKDGDYPKVGSVLDTHLTELVRRLVFDPKRHEKRYADLDPSQLGREE